MNYTKIEVNCETSEIVESEMTEQEIADYEAEQAVHKLKNAEAETKAREKTALLNKLNITADEAKLLLS